MTTRPTPSEARVNAHVTPLAGLTDEETRTVLAAATTAPSLYDRQPWRLVTSAGGINLYLDRDRLLPVADPDRQQALLACGAALVNLRLAIRVRDRHADVRLLPDPRQPDLLAAVHPQGYHPALPDERRIAAVLADPGQASRSFPFRAGPVSAAVRSRLHRAAATAQGWLVTVTGAQLAEVRRLLAHAHAHQVADPEFLAEFSRHAGRDGAGTQSGCPPPPGLGAVDGEPPLVAVIGSFHDTVRGRLQAGQAYQRVALTAVVEGLSVASLAPVVQIPATRVLLRSLLGAGIWPQAALQLGPDLHACRPERTGSG